MTPEPNPDPSEARSVADQLRILDQFALRAPPVPAWYAPGDADRLFSWPYFYASSVSVWREFGAGDLVAGRRGAESAVWTLAKRDARANLLRLLEQISAAAPAAPTSKPVPEPASTVSPAPEPPARGTIAIAPETIPVRATRPSEPAARYVCAECLHGGLVEELTTPVAACPACGSRQLRREPAP